MANESLVDRQILPEAIIGAKISATETASTLRRFFTSQHVADLRWIVIWTIFFFILYCCLMWWLYANSPSIPAGSISNSHILGHMHEVLGNNSSFLVDYIGPAIGFGGLIIGWAYQSASARLGIVDLFASEIGTLCRVGTIFDVASRYTALYERRPINSTRGSQLEGSSANFVSQEEYFPVFANNSGALQALGAPVIAHITEFYTYMKAIRDERRRMAGSSSTTPADNENVTAGVAWQASTINVIYMLFLAYESGRNALRELIEVRSIQTDLAISTLFTELTCYATLLTHFSNARSSSQVLPGEKRLAPPEQDFRYARLLLRREVYAREVKRICELVEKERGAREKYWARLRGSLPELIYRWRQVPQ